MSKKKENKEGESTAYLNWFIHLSVSVCFGILLLFLVINILFAQSIKSVERIFSGQKNELVEFFKNGRTLRSFTLLFPEVKLLFSSNERKVYEEDRIRRDKISKLEDALKINPKARDVLYSLYLLYDKSGNSQKAAEYLKLAQEVDPKIGKR